MKKELCWSSTQCVTKRPSPLNTRTECVLLLDYELRTRVRSRVI